MVILTLFRRRTIISEKLIFLAVVFMLCLASTSHGIVIGNFENTMDGWVVPTDAPAGTKASYGATGVTRGDNSLMPVASEDGFIPCLAYNIPCQDMVDAFRKAQKISVDVTRLTADWTVAGAGR